MIPSALNVWDLNYLMSFWNEHTVTEFQLSDRSWNFYCSNFSCSAQNCVQASSVKRAIAGCLRYKMTQFFFYSWILVCLWNVVWVASARTESTELQLCQVDLPCLFCCKTWLFSQAVRKISPLGMILIFMTLKKNYRTNRTAEKISSLQKVCFDYYFKNFCNCEGAGGWVGNVESSGNVVQFFKQGRPVG